MGGPDGDGMFACGLTCMGQMWQSMVGLNITDESHIHE